MDKRLLVKNGFVIDSISNREGQFDILVEAGKIKAVEKPGSFANLEGVLNCIDASSLLVVPGLIDLHVHLREPGYEWKETIKSGAQAALLGGFTSICAMPNTNPTNDAREVTEFILRQARAAKAARVLPIGAVSLALLGKELTPLSELKSCGCVAFSDDGEPIYNAGLMRRALEWCQMLGVSIACHEEDKQLSCCGVMNESGLSTRLGLKGWPKVAEEVMIARDIELARATAGTAHICHVSTARGIELIRRAKNDGINVTCEVTPHHLLLTEQTLTEFDTNSKMSPPLREESDRLALIAGLQDGTVDAVASDHAPHDLDSKQIEFGKAAFGILGLQTSLSLLLDFVADGHLTQRRAIELFTSGPARAFGLQYGSLAPGATADIALIDPAFEWKFSRDEVASLSFNSPFIDWQLKGRAQVVIVGGEVLVKDRRLVGRSGESDEKS